MAWRSTDRNLLRSDMDASSASVMQNPSKQNTAKPQANGTPHSPANALRPSNGDRPRAPRSWRSSLTTVATARTVHASAKMLNGAREDSERMKESAAWTGSRSARTTVAGESWPPLAKTEETFWPMKTRYATEPPVWERMMVTSVKYLPIGPKHFSPRSP
uniref:Uncharacterized protein n=1 Tax=Arundo donax TaxID=35708 RepID=A0A0A9EUY9_ARUDO